MDRTRGDKKEAKGLYDSSSSDDDDVDDDIDEEVENEVVEMDQVKLEAAMRAGTSNSEGTIIGSPSSSNQNHVTVKDTGKVAGSKKKRVNLEEGQQCSVADFQETAPILSIRMFEVTLSLGFCSKLC